MIAAADCKTYLYLLSPTEVHEAWKNRRLVEDFDFTIQNKCYIMSTTG
jgi:hypothetical protein